MKRLALTSAVLSSLLSAASLAAPGAHPCKADRERLCAGVQRGGGAIARCLAQHKDELSPACRAAAEEKLKQHPRPCLEDRERLCAGVKGREGVRACLQAHAAELSPGCREKLDKKVH